MKCQNCGSEMQPGHKFCEFCGAKAEPLVTRDTSRRESQYHSIKCHVCGAEVQPGVKSCKFCGAKLAVQGTSQSMNRPLSNREPEGRYQSDDEWHEEPVEVDTTGKVISKAQRRERTDAISRGRYYSSTKYTPRKKQKTPTFKIIALAVIALIAVIIIFLVVKPFKKSSPKLQSEVLSAQAKSNSAASSGSGGVLTSEGVLGPTVYAVSSREESKSGDGPVEDDSAWKVDYIALNSDNTGVFLFDNCAFSIRWTQEGNSFSFTDHMGNRFSGLISESEISGDYGRYHYTYERANVELPAFKLSPDTWGVGLPLIVDQGDALTDSEEFEVLQKAKTIVNESNIGIYAIFVDDLSNYTWSGKIVTLAEELKAGYALGTGEGDRKDSIVLTVALNDKLYDLCYSGENIDSIIQPDSEDEIVDAFLGDLKERNWGKAINGFLDKAGSILMSGTNNNAIAGGDTSNKSDSQSNSVSAYNTQIDCDGIGLRILSVKDEITLFDELFIWVEVEIQNNTSQNYTFNSYGEFNLNNDGIIDEGTTTLSGHEGKTLAPGATITPTLTFIYPKECNTDYSKMVLNAYGTDIPLG